MKCYVISNCTHAPIREYLSATGLFSEVVSEAIFTIPPDEIEARYELVKSFDVVYSTVLYTNRWGPFEHAAMKADLGDRVHLFDAPFFQGLHPDLIHIAQGDGRFQSPIGDYHSGLIYWGYHKGVAINELTQMYYDGELPACFDPKEAWDRSLNILNEREAPADVRIADVFPDICRRLPAMLTFNHPTMPVIAAQCDRFCERLFGNRTTTPIDPTNIYNPLLSDVIIPVSPATIKTQKLGYRTTSAYKFGLAAPQKLEGYLNFERFAQLSYARYNSIDTSQLRPTTPAPVAKALIETLAA